MSTADATFASVYSTEDVFVSVPGTPRLENGDRLTTGEFKRRYDAMPNIKRAELIEGIVYMASPVTISGHAQPHAHLITWLGNYVAKTPGLILADNGSNRLDDNNMPQPDAMLLLPESCQGTARIDAEDYASGPADFVCEIAASNASLALGKKLETYRRSGVREYLVYRTLDQAVDWLELIDGRYVGQPLNEHGRLESKLFPGLWLDPMALMAGDLSKLLATVDEGTKSAEHAEFVAKLQAAGGELPSI